MSYWTPDHLVKSAWLEHAPFAFWIIEATSPRVFVELGTHLGFSYFAVCQTVERLGLDTRAFALDTWEGDDHAGFYSEEVFDGVRGTNERYRGFSTLLRGYFNESLDLIEDGTIDLLHIDGRHGYEDVREDFFSWVPKLSDRAVVLFHDIAERANGFGVWRFWSEISSKYPSFAFDHEHGLGVLGVGSDIPERMRGFFEAATREPETIRATYEFLGSRISGLTSLHARAEYATTLEQRVAQRDADIGDLEADILGLHNQVNTIRASSSWKFTRPLRALASAVRRG